MDKEKIIDYIKYPYKLTATDKQLMQEWLRQYPYFQAARTLLAKITHDHQMPEKQAALSYAALYTPHRGVLKKFILSNLQKPESTHEAQVPPVETEPYVPFKPANEEDWEKKNSEFDQKLKENYLIKKEGPELEQEAPAEKETAEPQVNQQLVDEVLANIEKAKKIKQTYLDNEQNAEKESEEDGHDQSDTFSEKNSEQKALIDHFIENEKNFGRIKPQTNPDPPVDLSAKSTAFSDDMVSENLANIFQKQGKTEKAIDIYKKLIWKFPQKRAFFAACIDDLKNN